MNQQSLSVLFYELPALKIYVFLEFIFYGCDIILNFIMHFSLDKPAFYKMLDNAKVCVGISALSNMIFGSVIFWNYQTQALAKAKFKAAYRA